MRQASWIAFLLLAVGLLGYEASLDQQELVGNPDITAADTGTGDPPPPKP